MQSVGKQLAGKLALVTGGSQGIGFSIASLFAAEGARVLITGRDKSKLDAAQAAIKGDVAVIQSDASCIDDGEHLAEAVAKESGALDVAVFNAGYARQMPFCDVTEDEFDKFIGVNLKGPFFLTQQLMPHMSETASFIYIASVAGMMGFRNLVPYSIAKAALTQMPRSLAVEHFGTSKRFNAISPGHIHTPLTEGKQDDSALLSTIPLESRFGKPEEVAQLVLCLATTPYINAQNFVIDGGLTATVESNGSLY